MVNTNFFADLILEQADQIQKNNLILLQKLDEIKRQPNVRYELLIF